MQGNHSPSGLAIRAAKTSSSEFENLWRNGESNHNRQSRKKSSIAASSKVLCIVKVIRIETIKDSVKNCNTEGLRK